MSAQEPFRRLLLVRHYRRPVAPLLAGAVDLARRCGSDLTFAHALEGGDRIDELSRAELTNELRAALEPHLEGFAADYRVLDGDLAEVAAHAAGRYDLVLPAEAGDGSEASQRQLDRLLQTSPLPVWLDTGSGRTVAGILAAVDLQTGNPAKLALNPAIVRQAAFLAARLGARLDLLSVRAPEPVADRLVRKLAGDDQRLPPSRRQTRERLSSLLSDAMRGLPPLVSEPRFLVAQGDPDTLIAQAAESASIDLLVAGCVGRSGLAGLLIGDTAARLAKRLDCSILAVKPALEASEARPAGRHSRAA